MSPALEKFISETTLLSAEQKTALIEEFAQNGISVHWCEEFFTWCEEGKERLWKQVGIPDEEVQLDRKEVDAIIQDLEQAQVEYEQTVNQATNDLAAKIDHLEAAFVRATITKPE